MRTREAPALGGTGATGAWSLATPGGRGATRRPGFPSKSGEARRWNASWRQEPLHSRLFDKRSRMCAGRPARRRPPRRAAGTGALLLQRFLDRAQQRVARERLLDERDVTVPGPVVDEHVVGVAGH